MVAGLAFELHGCRRLPHELGQFLMRDFDQELSWLDGGQHFATQSLLFDRLDKILGGLEIDVRVQQRFPHFLQRVAHVDFCDGTVSFQHLEGALKSFLEVFKHVFCSGFPRRCGMQM